MSLLVCTWHLVKKGKQDERRECREQEGDETYVVPDEPENRNWSKKSCEEAKRSLPTSEESKERGGEVGVGLESRREREGKGEVAGRLESRREREGKGEGEVGVCLEEGGADKSVSFKGLSCGGSL